MKKRTAVEKMAEWLEDEIGHYVPYEKVLYIQLIISNAKAMEKEQIIEAMSIGYHQAFENQYETTEQYYNETYGGDK
jgi:hypothetical protein